ncbi:type 11 methyltransferase [Marinitoga sp. 1197]|uniref:class I SAM-dependent methyltransferase n=1 Tax=Marinitoga sp. 1197 TaxID=1428449 RepID=UPI00065A68AA|nr:class I SAM-dependent methyltransferase [Marinitoga sp. 1197]KLO21035.1 type 11 methyltransferase [Marinitoga sp. 1197]
MKSWEYYDKIANDYEKMYEDPYWEMHNLLSEKIIFENLKFVSGKVLDIGAGTGYWTNIFLNKGFDVYAVEPSPKMCSILKSKFKNSINIINDFAENLKFENESFDIILAMGDILSYSENDEKFLYEINRVLKKGGILIGTVDNLNKFIIDAFFSKDFDIIEVMKKQKKVNVGISKFMSFNSTLYTKNDLEKLLSNYFSKISIYGIMAFPWENELEFSKYWADVFELELKFSKVLYDTAEHLMYMVVK